MKTKQVFGYGLLAVIFVLAFAACSQPTSGHEHKWSAWTENQPADGTETRVCSGDIPHTETRTVMVSVPGGSFDMGKHLGTGRGSDITPIHKVTLTGFSLSKYEITQAQWYAVMGYTIEAQQALATSFTTNYGRGDNYPVYYVCWYDAIVFCNLLSEAEGLTPAYSIKGSTDPSDWGDIPDGTDYDWLAVAIEDDSTGYRLPTEAQWEYAAKGGDGTPGNYSFSGSNTVGDVAWYEDNNSPYGFKPVGTKAPNGLGIHDMTGNAWEWCWDRDGNYSSAEQTDPMGPASGSTIRIRRGGGYTGSAESVRSVARTANYPYYRTYFIGFRVARPQ